MIVRPRLLAVSVVALLLLILLTLSRNHPADEATDLVLNNTQQGRWMQALYQVEFRAAQAGWTPELLRLTGDLWSEMGDLTRALPYWEAAGTVSARRLAEVYLDLQQWTEAADLLAQLAAESPADPWIHYRLGLMRAAFDPRRATEDLEIARRDPRFRPVADELLRVLSQPDELLAMWVGLALARAELWPYAELAFQQAADSGAAYAEGMAYVSLARNQQGKDGAAWIEQALRAEPQNAVVRYLQGLHLRAEGDLAASLDALVAAVALDPSNPAYYAELGQAYRLVGDLENAERWLQTAVDTSFGDPRFQSLLALFYAEEAYQLNDDTLALLHDMTDNADVQAAYAWALYNLDDAVGALAQLDALLAAQPDHARSLFYKGRILLDQGDLDGARTLLEQVTAAESPFSAEARQLLNVLTGEP